jgi:periplasmic protein TonB
MSQLQCSTGSFRVTQPRATYTPQQRAFGIVFALAMEAGIIYAMLITLGYVETPLARPPLTIVNVAPLPENNDIPPPPPQTFEPPPVLPPMAPVVELTYVPPQPTVISLPPPPPVVPREVTPPPPVIFTPARAIAATHTIPEYPPLSRRLGERGTLRLKLTLNERGAVTDAVVVNSSGFQRLDDAAVQWIKTHWRYRPALQGSRPVASTTDAIVEFRLQ